ncbi:Protein KOKOPELLI [Hirschfeldia incana]|nr:Protein KOKOPELLI [Hirschfeldia incana]
MDPLNFETDLQSLRRLYGLLHSNANNESIPQAFLLDENTQFLLKRLLDSATEELLARQTKILAQVQLGMPTPSRNSVSRGIIKLPSRAGLTKEVVDSIERIETQLSAFSFCSSREDRTKTCKSRTMQDNSSSGMPFQRLNEKALMERRQSYQASVSGSRSRYMPASKQMSQTTRTSNVNNVADRDDRTMDIESQGTSSPDDQVVLVRSRTPLPHRPMRPERPRESKRTSLKMGSMKPTLLDQETETWDEDESGNTRSETSSQVSTDQESEEESRETGSTTGSSWQTHGESITETEDSSYPSESEASSQVSDSPPHKSRGRSKETLLSNKKSKGRLTRFKEKLGKVFHHHHYHHHHHESKETGQKPSAWKHLVKKHLQKDKEKLVERRMKSESKGLVTKHKKKGGQFHTLVEGLMRHRRRHSKMKKQSHVRKNNWWKKRRRQGIKFPNRGRVKLGKTNYLCNKDQEHDEK